MQCRKCVADYTPYSDHLTHLAARPLTSYYPASRAKCQTPRRCRLASQLRTIIIHHPQCKALRGGGRNRAPADTARDTGACLSACHTTTSHNTPLTFQVNHSQLNGGHGSRARCDLLTGGSSSVSTSTLQPVASTALSTFTCSAATPRAPASFGRISAGSSVLIAVAIRRRRTRAVSWCTRARLPRVSSRHTVNLSTH